METWIKDGELVKQRRSEISDAAYKVFASKGFHEATMREIARAANLGIGSLYDYIRRKEDLLDLIYQKTMAEAIRIMQEAIAPIDDPVAQMKILLKTNLEIVHRHQDFFLLMYQESAAMTKEALQRVFAMEREYVSLYRDILQRGRERGVFQVADVEFASIAIAFLCSVWALKRWNLKGHTLEAATERITHLVLEGVKRPAPARDGHPLEPRSALSSRAPANLPASASGRNENQRVRGAPRGDTARVPVQFGSSPKLVSNG